MLLLVEEPDFVARNVSLMIQLATSGGFGALVWYLIAKHIPAQNKESRQDAAIARDAFKEMLVENRSAFTDALIKIEESHREELVEMRGVTMQLVNLVQKVQEKG